MSTLSKQDLKSSRWCFNLKMLKTAAKIRQRNPNDFQSATLTFFGFGGRDDTSIMKRMSQDPEGHRLIQEKSFA